MKCVCPMGGDRTCPDNCLIAVWHNLPDDQKTPERRRPLVEQLRNQGYTQDAIANQLGVSQNTISLDIETLSIIDNVSERAKDTIGRTRSTGRPKGSVKPRSERMPQAVEREERVAALKDAGLSTAEISAAVGLGERAVAQALEHVEIRREAWSTGPNITRDDLSITAQQKYDIAVRQEKHRLGATFQVEVGKRVREFIEQNILPDWQEKIEHAKTLYDRRRGLMNKETFNIIRRALHPDSRNSISDKKLGEAFDTFMGLEKYLLDEKDSPTFIAPLPRTMAEWDAAKAKVKAERKAKRNNSANVARRA